MSYLVLPKTAHRHVEIDGIRIFYRETLPEPDALDAPTVLLLHGFPSASHQYRRLMDTLGARYRMIAPDYPGFGYSDVPAPASEGGDFTYSFDRLADIMEGFIRKIGLDHFILFAFDFGAPVGFRLALRGPGRITGLIVQNANAYDEGLSDAARNFVANCPDDPGAEEAIRDFLTLPATRSQYEGGTADPALVAPDGWTLDQHFLDLPGRDRPQIDLAFDYKTNLERYPEWQAWLRTHRPPTLIVWGSNDPIFITPGAKAYLRDVPEAELHLFDTGHFALEDKLPEIAPLIDDFLSRLTAGMR